MRDTFDLPVPELYLRRLIANLLAWNELASVLVLPTFKEEQNSFPH